MLVFFFQAEDGIRDLVRSRGLGDVYKRQHYILGSVLGPDPFPRMVRDFHRVIGEEAKRQILKLSLIHI